MPDDLPPLQWFVRRYGADNLKVDYTFEDLGISSAAQNISADGMGDTCTLSFAGLRPTAVPLFAPDSWLTLYGGSLPWFSGRVQAPDRDAAGNQERSSLQLRGPGADFGRHIYMAPAAYILTPPLAGEQGIYEDLPFSPTKFSAVSSTILLAQDQDGTLLDGMQTVRRALLYSQAAGAWFQLGNLPDTLAMPAESIQDRSVAELLLACFRWDPTLVSFWDYTTCPPTYHVIPAGSRPPVNLLAGDAPGATVTTCQAHPRPDLVLPGVVVQYVRDLVATPSFTVSTLSGPVSPSGGVFTGAVQVPAVQPTTNQGGIFVPAAGPGINSGDSHFVPYTGGAGITTTTGSSFVSGPSANFVPAGATTYSPDGKIIQSSGGTTAAPPTSADPAPPAYVPPAAAVSAAPEYHYRTIEYEIAGEPFVSTGAPVLKLGALAVTVTLDGGELSAVGYSPNGIRKPPYGIAAKLLAGRLQPPWEGRVAIRAQDVGFANFVGKAVNVQGADPEWETMAARCVGFTRNTATGETSLTLGVPTFLGAADFHALLKAARSLGVGSGATGVSTDPALPSSHDPLPAPAPGSGGGGGHPSGEGDRPEDQPLAPFLDGPGAVRGERHVVNKNEGYYEHDGTDHGPVALGAPWFEPEVATTDSPGLYYTLDLTAGYAFRDQGSSAIYDTIQTSDCRRSVTTIDLRGVQDPDATKRVELVGTNIASRDTGVNVTKRVRVDVTQLIGTRTLFPCPEPTDTGQEDHQYDPPEFPYSTQRSASVVFDKIAILDQARVGTGPPAPAVGDYENPPGSGVA